MLLESYPEVISELLGLMSDSVKLLKALQYDLTLSKIKPVVWWLCIERSQTVDKTLCQLAQLPYNSNKYSNTLFTDGSSGLICFLPQNSNHFLI